MSSLYESYAIAFCSLAQVPRTTGLRAGTAVIEGLSNLDEIRKLVSSQGSFIRWVDASASGVFYVITQSESEKMVRHEYDPFS